MTKPYNISADELSEIEALLDRIRVAARDGEVPYPRTHLLLTTVLPVEPEPEPAVVSAEAS